MLKTRNGKIILGIVVLLLIIVAIILMVSKNQQSPQNQTTQTPTGQKTTVPIGSLPNGAGGTGTGGFFTSPTASGANQTNSFPTPSATPIKTDVGNGIVEYVEPANPYPGSGDLDWTHSTRKIIDVTNSPFSGKTMCQISDLSDSWSSPIEKFVCDSMNFFNDKIVNQLDALDCIMAGASLQANYATNLSWEYKDGQCKILDR